MAFSAIVIVVIAILALIAIARTNKHKGLNHKFVPSGFTALAFAANTIIWLLADQFANNTVSIVIITLSLVLAILVATNFGRTARRISGLKPPCPIIAAASNNKVVKSLQLHFGVLPVNAKGDTLDELIENVKKELETTFKLNPGDKIIITGGYPFKKVKYTNFMQIDEI